MDGGQFRLSGIPQHPPSGFHRHHRRGLSKRIDTVAAAIHAGMTADQVYDMDLAYAPPFGPSWSPLLIAASKLSKAMGK